MTQQFDRKTAAAWDDKPQRVLLARNVARAMIQGLGPRPEWTVLDYGAGTGLITLEFAPLVRRVLAVDASEAMLGVLAEKIAHLGLTSVRPLRWSAGQPLPELPRPDAVVSSMVLHHVADVPGLIREFHGLLAPGGRVAVADLDPDGGQFHAGPIRAEHEGFDRAGLARVFREAGFTDLSFATAAEVTKPGADGIMRAFSVFLLTGTRA